MDQRLSAVLAETLEQRVLKRVLPADPLAASHMRSSALRKEITGGGDQDVGGKGSPHEVPDTAFKALAEELRRIRSQPHAPTIKHLKHMSSPLPAIDQPAVVEWEPALGHAGALSTWRRSLTAARISPTASSTETPLR